MDRHIYDDVLDDFKLYFPSMVESMVNWHPSGRHEITVKLDDQGRFVYNYLTKSIRRIATLEDEVDNLPEHEWRRKFGIRLESIMMDKGITQTELADLSKINRVSLNSYINGKTLPSTFNLVGLARALGCSVSELTDFE